MPNKRSTARASDDAPGRVDIERAGEVLSFTLDHSARGNEVTGAMLEAMLAELRSEAAQPRSRVLRILAKGKVFCTGRERAGRDLATVRLESERILDFKRSLRTSPLISVAEVHGDALGFGFGLAIVSDFAIVSQRAALGFPEMRHGLAPSAIMSYLGEYALPRHAFPLVLFGETMTPKRALEVGLISQVSPASRLSKDVDALIQRILRLDPAAARRCKQFFLDAQQNPFDENVRLAVEALTSGSMAALATQK